MAASVLGLVFTAAALVCVMQVIPATELTQWQWALLVFVLAALIGQVLGLSSR